MAHNIFCPRCKKDGSVVIKAMNHGTKEMDTHIIACPSCSGKGYLTPQDIREYYDGFYFEGQFDKNKIK